MPHLKVTYLTSSDFVKFEELLILADDPEQFAGEEARAIVQMAATLFNQIKQSRSWTDWDGHSRIDFTGEAKKTNRLVRVLVTPWRFISAFWNHITRFRLPPAE